MKPMLWISLLALSACSSLPAPQQTANQDEPLIWFQRYGNWGAIDTAGREVIAPTINSQEMPEKIAPNRYLIHLTSNNSAGLINRKGEYIIDPSEQNYEGLWKAGNYLLYVNSQTTGLMDVDGKQVRPPINTSENMPLTYLLISPEIGLTYHRGGGEQEPVYYFSGPDNQPLSSDRFEEVLPSFWRLMSGQGFDEIDVYSLRARPPEGECIGIPNPQGGWLVPPKFGEIHPYHQGVAVAQSCGNSEKPDVVGLIDQQGNWIKQLTESQAFIFGDTHGEPDALGRYTIKSECATPRECRHQKSKIWQINRQGQTVFEPENVEWFSGYSQPPGQPASAVAYIEEHGQEKIGLMDAKGNWLIPPQDNWLGTIEANGLVRSQQTKPEYESDMKLLTPSGEVVFPTENEPDNRLYHITYAMQKNRPIIVNSPSKNDIRSLVLDENGKKKFETPYYLRPYNSFGYTLAEARDASAEQGVMDAAGNWVIPPKKQIIHLLNSAPLAEVLDQEQPGGTTTYLMDMKNQRVVPYPVEKIAEENKSNEFTSPE